MAIVEKNVSAGVPYTLNVTFDGDARYKIAEYGPDGSGGWKKTKDIQTDGDSTDPQHDTYNMTPVVLGQSTLVRVAANMSSATGDADVSMGTHFFQSSTKYYEDKASGHDSGDEVPLSLVVVMKGA